MKGLRTLGAVALGISISSSGAHAQPQPPNFGLAGYYMNVMSTSFAQRLSATVDNVNSTFGTDFSMTVSPPTLEGHPLFEFDSWANPELQGFFALTSTDEIPAIAINAGELDFSSESLSNQVNTLKTLLHELGHVVWSDNFWSLFWTDPLYYAELANCHSTGDAEFGPCDEAYSSATEAAGLCATICEKTTGDGALPPTHPVIKKLKDAYKEAAKDCVEESADCDAKNGECGDMPMPGDWNGCPGTTCNC